MPAWQNNGVNAFAPPRQRAVGRLLPVVLLSTIMLTGCETGTGQRMEQPASSQSTTNTGSPPDSPASSAPSGSEEDTGTRQAETGATPSEPDKANDSAETQVQGTDESSEPAETQAQESAQAVEQSMKQLAAQTPAPDQDQMIEAIAAAGLPVDAVEVSTYRTPTGLDVAAIQAAVPIEGQCVVSEVRDGEVTVTLLPVLESGLCFVGDQR